jgi:hypothetical protein
MKVIIFSKFYKADFLYKKRLTRWLIKSTSNVIRRNPTVFVWVQ